MYASFLLEPLGAGLPATSYRDGIDTGGLAFDMQSMMPNAEENEWFYPILYLWRKELPDSGGAGKYRGGNSGELAIVGHDTDRVNMYLASAHNAIPGLASSAECRVRLHTTSCIAATAGWNGAYKLGISVIH